MCCSFPVFNKAEEGGVLSQKQLPEAQKWKAVFNF